MVIVLIIGILATLGMSKYFSMIEHARVVQAIGDIKAISYAVNDYWMAHNDYPDDLAAIGEDGRQDPWGRPYAYLPIEGRRNLGLSRKDKNLVPINTDFDLYSKGPDGASQPPLLAASSKDDIVRAANGGYIGRAENY
jgi:general secretion pathway protein G